jgi:hypothetical protein
MKRLNGTNHGLKGIIDRLKGVLKALQKAVNAVRAHARL